MGRFSAFCSRSSSLLSSCLRHDFSLDSFLSKTNEYQSMRNAGIRAGFPSATRVAEVAQGGLMPPARICGWKGAEGKGKVCSLEQRQEDYRTNVLICQGENFGLGDTLCLPRFRGKAPPFVYCFYSSYIICCRKELGGQKCSLSK